MIALHFNREQRAQSKWLAKHQRLADDQSRDLALAYHASLYLMRSGLGDEQAWSTLACSLNIAMLLAEGGNKAGNLPCIQHAQASLMRCRERSLRLGKWGFSGDELKAVMRALAIHDEQIETTPRATLIAALHEVHRRVTGGAVFSSEGAA